MSATTAPMTVDEYYAITVEGDRMQLVGGEPVVNDPRLRHGMIQLELLRTIGNWVKAGEGRGLVGPPTDVVIGEHDVYGPDVVWIAERNLPADPNKRLERVPDLCVEVRSPSTWRYDIGRKKATYEAGGLPELLLVDHVAETVLVFRRSKPAEPTFDVALELTAPEELTSPQLPGYSLPLAQLFEH